MSRNSPVRTTTSSHSTPIASMRSGLFEKGYRLCLVYNLTLGKSKKSISAPRIAEHIEEKIVRSSANGPKTTRQEKLGIQHRPSVHGRMASPGTP